MARRRAGQVQVSSDQVDAAQDEAPAKPTVIWENEEGWREPRLPRRMKQPFLVGRSCAPQAPIRFRVSLALRQRTIFGHLGPTCSGAAVHESLRQSPPPDGVRWLVTSIYVFGSFGLIVILGTVAFLSHRRVVLRDLATAGLAAFAFSALMWLVFGMTGGRPNGPRP